MCICKHHMVQWLSYYSHAIIWSMAPCSASSCFGWFTTIVWRSNSSLGSTSFSRSCCSISSLSLSTFCCNDGKGRGAYTEIHVVLWRRYNCKLSNTPPTSYIYTQAVSCNKLGNLLDEGSWFSCLWVLSIEPDNLMVGVLSHLETVLQAIEVMMHAIIRTLYIQHCSMCAIYKASLV